MKKILFLIAIVLSFGLKAQVFTPIHNYQAPDGLAVIKAFGIPYGPDTTWNGITPSINGTVARPPGFLFYRTADSTVYVWAGTRWIVAGSGGGGGGTGVRDTIEVAHCLFITINPANGRQVININCHDDGLVAGGIVTSAGCMDIEVSPASYYLSGTFYQTTTIILTVGAADPTNPRKDLVVVDTLGNVSIIPGTPSPIPSLPYHNPASQLIINIIDVPAGATCLAINSIVIYDETGGTEYTPTTSGTITNNPNDLSNPKHLVTDWSITSYADGAQMILTKPSGQDTVFSNSVFVGFLWLNNPFTGRQAQMQLFLAGVPVTSNISINPYFNSLDTAEYQILPVPHYAFGASGNIIYDKIVFTLRGNDLSGASGFYLDYLQLQTGISNTGLSLLLTTNGSSGPATLNGNVLNIPVYNSFADSTFQWSVLDSLSTPAVAPSDGDIFLVGTSPTGAFTGHANNIATYNAVAGTYTFDTVTVVGTLLYNAATKFVSKWTGTAWVRVGPSIPSGAGITNRITKWTSPNTLGTSLLFDNGTNIGLGTVTPTNYFHIFGANKFIEFENTGTTASGFFWRKSGNDAYVVQVAGANAIIPTSALGDIAVRTTGKNILFNTDGGTGLPAFGIAATTGNIFMKVQPGVSGTADSALIRDLITGVVSMKKIGTGSGTVTNVAALTLGTTGTDLTSSVANPTTTPVITLNVPTASATNRGALSNTDWVKFDSAYVDVTAPTDSTVTFRALDGHTKTVKILGGGTLLNHSPLSYVQINGTTPVYVAQIPLTTDVTGVLPIANGGTNNGSLSVTAGNLFYSDGSKLVGFAHGTAAQALRWNGSGYFWADTTAASGGAFWSLTGNLGLTFPNISRFIGTTDNTGLIFKTNGIYFVRIDSIGTLKVRTPTSTGTDSNSISLSPSTISTPYIQFQNSIAGSAYFTNLGGGVFGIGTAIGGITAQLKAGSILSSNTSTSSSFKVTAAPQNFVVGGTDVFFELQHTGTTDVGGWGSATGSPDIMGRINSATSVSTGTQFIRHFGATQHTSIGNNTADVSNVLFNVNSQVNATNTYQASRPAPIMTSSQRDSILTGIVQSNWTVTNAGTGYTPGSYLNQVITGGTGAGGHANITVNGSGNVSVITITDAGGYYTLGDALSASLPAGSGFVFTLTTSLTTTVTGAQVYCTNCTATDASTGVLQVYNGTTWKNAW